MIALLGWIMVLAIVTVVVGMIVTKAEEYHQLGKMLLILGFIVLVISGIPYGVLTGLRDADVPQPPSTLQQNVP